MGHRHSNQYFHMQLPMPVCFCKNVLVFISQLANVCNADSFMAHGLLHAPQNGPPLAGSIVMKSFSLIFSRPLNERGETCSKLEEEDLVLYLLGALGMLTLNISK